MQRRYLSKFVHFGRTEIAHADRTDFTSSMQRAHGFRDFRCRRIRVGPVNLVEIDDVGLQSAQGVLHLLNDARLSSIPKWLAILPVETRLRGDECPFAPTIHCKGLADDFLRMTETIDGSCVD